MTHESKEDIAFNIDKLVFIKLENIEPTTSYSQIKATSANQKDWQKNKFYRYFFGFKRPGFYYTEGSKSIYLGETLPTEHSSKLLVTPQGFFLKPRIIQSFGPEIYLISYFDTEKEAKLAYHTKIMELKKLGINFTSKL